MKSACRSPCLGGRTRVRRIAVLLSLAVLAGSCRGRGKKDEQYKTEKADRGDITQTVTATGGLSAVTTVQVGSQVSGVIARLYADYNSRVKKGQLLAELDPTPFQAQVEQRQADLTKASVEAANAKVSLTRQDRLVKAGIGVTADYDTAKANYDADVAQVKQSEAALSQATTNLGYTKIISPIEGIVVDRAYDVGQTVAASFQAPTLFQIAQDLTKMQVQADVDQSDIGRVHVGQDARFTVDSYPDQEFRGRIAQIRLNATVSQNVVTYPVIVEVANPEQKLTPKMTANITIDVANVQNVLRIPNAALRFKPDNAPATAAAPANRQVSTTAQGPAPERAASQMGDRRPGIGGAGGAFAGRAGGGPNRRPPQTVWVMDPATKKLNSVQIRTGITDGRFTEVVSGDLKEGDNVVVGLATSKVEGRPPPGSSNAMGGRGGAGGRGGR